MTKIPTPASPSVPTHGILNAALCTFLLTASMAAHANLLTNGSFEGAPQTTTGPAYGNGSTAITGWTVYFAGDTNPNANIQWLSNANTYGSAPYTQAQDGNSFIDLTGLADVQPYAGIFQTFATTAGQDYKVTFYLGCDNNSSGYYCPVGVNASVDGALSVNYVNTLVNAGNQWVQEIYTFTAGAGSTSTLRFRAFAPGPNSIYIGLDNVNADRVGVAAVPEPGSVALLGAGLLAFILGSRRRRS